MIVRMFLPSRVGLREPRQHGILVRVQWTEKMAISQDDNEHAAFFVKRVAISYLTNYSPGSARIAKNRAMAQRIWKTYMDYSTLSKFKLKAVDICLV